MVTYTGKESAYRRHQYFSCQPYLVAAAVLVVLFQVVLLETTSIDGVLVSAFRNTPVTPHHPRGLLVGLEPHHRVLSCLYLSEKSMARHENSGDSRSFENREAVQPLSKSSIGNLPIPAEFTSSSTPTLRSIRVERIPRLPVWPVWAGVVDFFVGWIFGAEAGSKLEQYFLGGRVCPMQLDGTSTSPFLLLVHHHHNFWKWDAIFRKVSAFVLPEGFPAHPHRGFTTLTYFLPDDEGKGGGGFVHRDSIGVKQTYGSKGSYKHQAQWLFTGRGMLHEEMFDHVQNDLGEDNPSYNSRYELYQLWVNVPGVHKLDPPKVQLLRTCEDDGHGDEEPDAMPRVATSKTMASSVMGERLTTTCGVVVIAGSYRPHEDYNDDHLELFTSQAGPLHSDLSILHVTVEETAKTTPTTPTSSLNDEGSSSPGWIYDIPPDHDTLIVYVRKGSCTMETTTVSPTGTTSSRSSPTEVPIHSTVFVEKDPASGRGKEQLIIRPNQLDDPLDLLVLSGRPLYQSDSKFVEPVAMQGSMVMNNDAQIQQAYTDYQYGQMGLPWDHTLEDEEWMDHVRKTKSRIP